MTLTDLILWQVADPFRIGLLVGLIVTAARTQGAGGLIVPLIAGAVFIAAIIPMTLKPAGEDVLRQVATGIVVNGLYLALYYGLRALWQRR